MGAEAARVVGRRTIFLSEPSQPDSIHPMDSPVRIGTDGWGPILGSSYRASCLRPPIVKLQEPAASPPPAKCSDGRPPVSCKPVFGSGF